MKNKTLTVNGISLNYGQRFILSDVHLQCQTGQIIGILGHNGSGKSCLLKIMYGSLQPEQRHINVDGKTYLSPLYTKRNAIKYLPQKGYLPLNLKVKHAIRYFVKQQADLDILQNDATISHIHNTSLRFISGGERRYLESMLLLYSEADFVLLDEPFNKLFPLQIENLQQVIKNCRNKGIVITDHFYNHLWEVSDQVYFLKNGNLGKVSDKYELEQLGYLVKTSQKYAPLPADFNLSQPSRPIITGAEVLEELEIESSTPGRFNLFDMINSTWSKGGEMVLQDILRHPRKDTAEIIPIQEAIQFIADNQEIFNLKISNGQLMTIENYLESNIVVESYSQDWQFQLAGIRQYLLNKNDHEIIAHGINALTIVLQEISSLTRILKDIQSPSVITSICKDFHDLCRKEKIQYLLATELRYFQVLQYDYLFRKRWHQQLKIIIDSFYDLDALVSMAKAKDRMKLVFPRFNVAENLKIDSAFHPALKKPTGNQLYLGHEHLLFLTGPNMAGKTTYLKSVALCVYLAHTGMAVPARSMELSPFDCIFTSLNTSDNIEQGYSYFMNEANQVKKLALLLQEGYRVFAIMDELFRGTNIKDAYAGTEMVVDGLRHWNKSNFLMSTHLSELAKDFHQLPNIQFRFFEGKLEQQKIKFSYQLKNGVSNQHLGMHILKDLGIDKLLNPDSHINP